MNDLVSKFEQYTNMGFKVIPLRPKSKIPVWKRWNEKWNKSRAYNHLKKNPNSNIALVLGKIIDVEGDSPEANETIFSLIGDIPHPSYNQDHRAVYEACLTALRPHDINSFVKKVLIYEQPHVAFWSHNYRAFQPNHFKPIDIEKKNHLYSMIATQVRSFRSPAHVRAIAAMRGAQSNCEYAEAFEIIRWID
jgi:hypothetical protein